MPDSGQKKLSINIPFEPCQRVAIDPNQSLVLQSIASLQSPISYVRTCENNIWLILTHCKTGPWINFFIFYFFFKSLYFQLSRLTSLFVLRRTQEINNKYLPPKGNWNRLLKISREFIIIHSRQEPWSPWLLL